MKSKGRKESGAHGRLWFPKSILAEMGIKQSANYFFLLEIVLFKVNLNNVVKKKQLIDNDIVFSLILNYFFIVLIKTSQKIL